MPTTGNEFPIGTTYTPRGGKHAQPQRTVIDIYKTYNSAGELVEVRYVSKHTFLRQEVIERDVVATTIAMGNPKLPE